MSPFNSRPIKIKFTLSWHVLDVRLHECEWRVWVFLYHHNVSLSWIDICSNEVRSAISFAREKPLVNALILWYWYWNCNKCIQNIYMCYHYLCVHSSDYKFGKCISCEFYFSSMRTFIVSKLRNWDFWISQPINIHRATFIRMQHFAMAFTGYWNFGVLIEWSQSPSRCRIIIIPAKFAKRISSSIVTL